MQDLIRQPFVTPRPQSKTICLPSIRQRFDAGRDDPGRMAGPPLAPRRATHVSEISGPQAAARPASRDARIVAASCSDSTSEGDRMMFGPDTRSIVPAS